MNKVDVKSVVGMVTDAVQKGNDLFDDLDQPWNSLVALAVGAGVVAVTSGVFTLVLLGVVVGARLWGTLGR